MNAHHRKTAVRFSRFECYHRVMCFAVNGRQIYFFNPLSISPLQHLVAVVIELFCVEVGVGVYQHFFISVSYEV